MVAKSYARVRDVATAPRTTSYSACRPSGCEARTAAVPSRHSMCADAHAEGLASTQSEALKARAPTMMNHAPVTYD